MHATTIILRSGFSLLLVTASITALCGCGGGSPNTSPPASAATAAPDKRPARVSLATADAREVPPSNTEARSSPRRSRKFSLRAILPRLPGPSTSTLFYAVPCWALTFRKTRGGTYWPVPRSSLPARAVLRRNLPTRSPREAVIVCCGTPPRRRAKEPLFRRINAHGAIGYVDFILLREAGGKVQIGDVYDYAMGGLQSDYIHQQSLCQAAEASPGFLERLAPIDRDYVRHVGSVREMRNLVAAERYREALDVYQGLPELVKNYKYVLQTRAPLLVPI